MALEQKIMEVELGRELSNISGECMGIIILKPVEKYKIYAYPGEEVVGQFRAEHHPYHCHIKKNNEQIYRVSFESNKIIELDQKRLPKKLKNHLINNSEKIQNRIEEVFHTGEYSI
ncbi:hypothetical protein HOD61_00470 [archaeon]|jgi:hypothetical protein|nr:hypothetical protein [archaeon]